jgi:ATP synthase A1 C subunit
MDAGDRIEPFMVYFNTRVRAMKSALLTREQMEDLLNQGDPGRLIEFLLNSPYGAEMAESLTRYEGADAVEDAVSRNLVSTFQRLLGFATGEFKDLAEAFLQRWDLIAAKALLRSKHHNLAPEEALRSVPPGPTLTVPLLRDMVERDSMPAVVAGLVAWDSSLSRPVEQQLGEYLETRDLNLLEDALDRRYFLENVRKLRVRTDEDSRFLVDFLQMEIDRINLRLLFQLRRSAEGASERFLPQGKIAREALQRLAAAESPEQAAELLASTPYRDLAAELYRFLDTGRFSPLERAFERLMMAEIRRQARTHIFSIAVLMLYAWLKHNEVLNLRLIARGLARHLPQSRVREELVYA